MKFKQYLSEYGRRGSGKKAAKSKWMSDTLDIVKKVIPKIEAPTPQDFWDTATYFFNQGMTSQDAAKKLIKNYK